jgi:hypothetical protein
MTTLPQAVLALALVLGGIATAGYLSESTRRATATRAAAPPPPLTCQMGNILIYPNCVPTQPGNTNVTLNEGNKFSTPGEFANIYVANGSVRVDYLYNHDEHRYFQAGQTFGVSRDNIIVILENNTRLQKRPY